jgi:esterase/lipase superfamily enzyme
MRRDVVELWSPELRWSPRVLAYGSYGRPVLVFPSSEGRADDYESNGMVQALRPLIDAGRVKLYCLDSWDSGSWYRDDVPLEERAQLHEAYERWVVEGVVPFVDADCGGRQEMAVTGCSFGAYHAANIALRRADLFPLAVCLSGVYDLSVLAGVSAGTSFHLNTRCGRCRRRRRAPRLAAQPAVAAARLRPGDVGRTPPARSRAPGRSARCAPRRACGSRPTCGGTTSARLAVLAGAARHHLPRFV